MTRYFSPHFVLLLSLLYLLSGQSSQAVIADTLEAMQEKVIGAIDAPVTIIEYASLTCPHCGHFHNDILPLLKAEFIDTGRVRFIYRDLPLDHYALRAAMLARCNSHRNYFAFLEVLYKEQARWLNSQDPLVALLRLARLGGINGADFKQCVGNKGLEDGILQNSLDSAKKYNLTSTPSLIINGDLYKGPLTFDNLKETIEDISPSDNG